MSILFHDSHANGLYKLVYASGVSLIWHKKLSNDKVH